MADVLEQAGEDGRGARGFAGRRFTTEKNATTASRGK